MTAHLDEIRLLDYAVGQPRPALLPEEEVHLQCCQECRTQLQTYRNEFLSAIEMDVPSTEIQQFRTHFQKAWFSKPGDTLHTLAGSAVRHPVWASVLALATLVLMSGTGYGIAKSMQSDLPAMPALNVVLMPGQRILDRPELLPLFPKVDHPTVISNTQEANAGQEQFMVHGYLEDNTVQVLWQL